MKTWPCTKCGEVRKWSKTSLPEGQSICHPCRRRLRRGLCEHCGKDFDAKGPVGRRRFCSVNCANNHRNGHARSPGLWRVNKEGYIERRNRGKRELQHRLVMAEVIGRPLYPFETPHHKNGIRADNRPENLELWTTWQHSGQRVEDLVAFVKKYYLTEEAA